MYFNRKIDLRHANRQKMIDMEEYFATFLFIAPILVQYRIWCCCLNSLALWNLRMLPIQEGVVQWTTDKWQTCQEQVFYNSQNKNSNVTFMIHITMKAKIIKKNYILVLMNIWWPNAAMHILWLFHIKSVILC